MVWPSLLLQLFLPSPTDLSHHIGFVLPGGPAVAASQFSPQPVLCALPISLIFSVALMAICKFLIYLCAVFLLYLE